MNTYLKNRCTQGPLTIVAIVSLTALTGFALPELNAAGEHPEDAAEPARSGRLRISSEMPDGAVFKGFIGTPEERLVLYRHPTRVERTREIVRAHTPALDLRKSRSPALPLSERIRRRIRGFARTVRTSKPEQVFAGAFLFALTSMAGFGWMEQHRHIRRRNPSHTLALWLRRHLRSRVPPRSARPKSGEWVDAWMPSPRAVSRRNYDQMPEPTPASTPPLTGSIQSFSIENTLQILSNAKQTGALIVNSENFECVGSFKFYKGKLAEVYCGEVKGEDAAFSLLTRAKGFYELRNIPVSANDITTGYDLTGMLLEVHRRIDEANAI